MSPRKLLVVLLGAAALIASALAVWASGTAGAASAPDTSPLTGARFELTIDGHSLAVFQELVGISSDAGGPDLALVTKGDNTVLRIPGKRTPPTITLRRAMTRNIEMAAWHELVILGDVGGGDEERVHDRLQPEGGPGGPVPPHECVALEGRDHDRELRRRRRHAGDRDPRERVHAAGLRLTRGVATASGDREAVATPTSRTFRALALTSYDARVAELPRGTVTFVFTDIEGSTGLLKQLGEHYGEVLTRHRRIVREAFTAASGVEIDTQGDAFFFAFPALATRSRRRSTCSAPTRRASGRRAPAFACAWVCTPASRPSGRRATSAWTSCGRRGSAASREAGTSCSRTPRER